MFLPSKVHSEAALIVVMAVWLVSVALKIITPCASTGISIQPVISSGDSYLGINDLLPVLLDKSIIVLSNISNLGVSFKMRMH